MLRALPPSDPSGHPAVTSSVYLASFRTTARPNSIRQPHGLQLKSPPPSTRVHVFGRRVRQSTLSRAP